MDFDIVRIDICDVAFIILDFTGSTSIRVNDRGGRLALSFPIVGPSLFCCTSRAGYSVDFPRGCENSIKTVRRSGWRDAAVRREDEKFRVTSDAKANDEFFLKELDECPCLKL